MMLDLIKPDFHNDLDVANNFTLILNNSSTHTNKTTTNKQIKQPVFVFVPNN